jgi:hypothetical protein
VMMNLKSSKNNVKCFPKTLFTLPQCRIAGNDGSGDMLSQSQMHSDDRDEEVLVAQQRRRRKNLVVFVGS